MAMRFPMADYVGVFEFIGAEPGAYDTEEPTWVLDAVPCDALDDMARRLQIPNMWAELPPVPFLLLTIPGQYKLVQQLRGEEGVHVRVTVSRQSRGGDNEVRAFATQSNERRRDNRPFFINVDRSASVAAYVNTLEKIAEFSHIADIPDLHSIAPHLREGYSTGHAVAVYDVGQGSLSALVSHAEHPLIFFDMGWPLSFFAKSIPKTAKHFAPFATDYEEAPAPVVLSHLDWDHWAYVYEKGRARWDKKKRAWITEPTYRQTALERPWLMRRPRVRRHGLGGSHIHLLQKLASMTYGPEYDQVLNFWPETSIRKRLGPVVVFKCEPAPGSKSSASFRRNNEGLGMLVYGSPLSARVLLSGDADYPSIPDFAKRRLTGLVAPHHGGAITPGSTPNALGNGRMVMSVSPGSYSNMPSQDVVDEAYEFGWEIAMTSERVRCFRAGKKIRCGNQLLRLQTTPLCSCSQVPDACLCISRMPDR